MYIAMKTHLHELQEQDSSRDEFCRYSAKRELL